MRIVRAEDPPPSSRRPPSSTTRRPRAGLEQFLEAPGHHLLLAVDDGDGRWASCRGSRRRTPTRAPRCSSTSSRSTRQPRQGIGGALVEALAALARELRLLRHVGGHRPRQRGGPEDVHLRRRDRRRSVRHARMDLRPPGAKRDRTYRIGAAAVSVWPGSPDCGGRRAGTTPSPARPGPPHLTRCGQERGTRAPRTPRVLGVKPPTRWPADPPAEPDSSPRRRRRNRMPYHPFPRTPAVPRRPAVLSTWPKRAPHHREPGRRRPRRTPGHRRACSPGGPTTYVDRVEGPPDDPLRLARRGREAAAAAAATSSRSAAGSARSPRPPSCGSRSAHGTWW